LGHSISSTRIKIAKVDEQGRVGWWLLWSLRGRILVGWQRVGAGVFAGCRQSGHVRRWVGGIFTPPAKQQRHQALGSRAGASATQRDNLRSALAHRLGADKVARYLVLPAEGLGLGRKNWQSLFLPASRSTLHSTNQHRAPTHPCSSGPLRTKPSASQPF